MIRTMLYSAIFIFAIVGMTGCGSDPASATGNSQNEGPLPKSAPDTNAGGASSAQPSAPPAASNPTVQPVPGQAVGGSGGTGALPPNAGAAPGAAPGTAPGVGAAPGAAPPGAGAAPGAAPAQPANWLNYTSQQFKFSITYPDVYVVADQGNLPQGVANLIHRVSFQDKALASSPTANLQPPQFMIDVFENKDGLVLEDWVAANERRATPTEVNVGNMQGYIVSLQTMQAPNQFYFVSQGQHVYRLTPLGQYSAEMLRSFKFG